MINLDVEVFYSPEDGMPETKKATEKETAEAGEETKRKYPSYRITLRTIRAVTALNKHCKDRGEKAKGRALADIIQLVVSGELVHKGTGKNFFD